MDQSESNYESIMNPPDLYEAQYVDVSEHTFDPNTNKKMINEYELRENIGKGSYGKVKRVTRHYRVDEQSEQEETADYAMKIFHRPTLKSQRTCFYDDNGKEPRMTDVFEFALNEVNIWKYLNHKNICKLFQVIDNEEDEKDQLYLIMQLGDLGCLMDYDEVEQKYIRNQKVVDYFVTKYNLNKDDEKLIEKVAKLIFKQVAEGIEYLYKESIVHRDIKIDNIICSSQYEPDECVKITDFSTARQINCENPIYFDCAGTPCYRAPEVQLALDTGYNPKKSDIWSFGITLYVYLHTTIPFFAESELLIDAMASKQDLIFEPSISDLAKELINKCCAKNPDNRLTIEEIMKHPWFQL